MLEKLKKKCEKTDFIQVKEKMYSNYNYPLHRPPLQGLDQKKDNLECVREKCYGVCHVNTRKNSLTHLVIKSYFDTFSEAA